MGQAGFLEKVEQDEYQLRLHKEYRFSSEIWTETDGAVAIETAQTSSW